LEKWNSDRHQEIQEFIDDLDPAHTPKGRNADERFTLAQVFAALQHQPERSPEPGRVFRAQQG
jgi:hypothetical protein